jgi:20S proteasome subunit beta 7
MDGGSVLAIKYDRGVLLGADTLLNYGSLAKMPNVPRIKIIGEKTAICASGDYADFCELSKVLEEKIMHTLLNDGDEPTTASLFNRMQRSMYHQRNEFDPYLNKAVLIGSEPPKAGQEAEEAEAFLGVVDSIGTRWTDDVAATGIAAHQALPVLRRAVEVAQMRNRKLNFEEAKAVLTDALRIGFYRECRAINRFQIANATNGTVTISEPFLLDTNFEFQGFAFDKTAIITL